MSIDTSSSSVTCCAIVEVVAKCEFIFTKWKIRDLGDKSE